LRFGLEIVNVARDGERIVGDKVDTEGRKVRDGGDSGLKIGLELFCVVCFPGCGVAGEDY
jgi:hypothetical protein